MSETKQHISAIPADVQPLAEKPGHAKIIHAERISDTEVIVDLLIRKALVVTLKHKLRKADIGIDVLSFIGQYAEFNAAGKIIGVVAKPASKAVKAVKAVVGAVSDKVETIAKTVSKRSGTSKSTKPFSTITK